MPELAVDHLFAAGDPDAAASQACAIVPRLFREGREATFARWLSRLDDDGLRRQPFLAVLGAWMHTILGRPADAERLADLSHAAEYDGERPPGAELYEEARASVLALMARNGLDTAAGHARDAVAVSTRFSAWRPQSQAVLGSILVLQGDRTQGEAILAESANAAEVLGASRALVFANAWRALSAIEREDWATGEALSRLSGRRDADRTAPVDRGRPSVVARGGRAPRSSEARARWPRSPSRRARRGHVLISVRCLLEAARVNLALPTPRAPVVPPAGGDILVRRPRLGSLGGRSPSCAPDQEPAARPGAPPPHAAEVRVLRLPPTYLTAAEMAERLFVTPNTVRTRSRRCTASSGPLPRRGGEAAIEIGLLEPLPVLAPGGSPASDDASRRPARLNPSGSAGAAQHADRSAMADRRRPCGA
jgi:hypothetical protein